MSDLKEIAKKAIGLMDLTTLNDDDTDEKVIALSRQAHTAVGDTAALCIYPRFVPIANKTLIGDGTRETIRIATVTNFPHGGSDIDIAVAETRASIAYGADEVDVVFPYRALMAGDEDIGYDLVKACRDVCGDKLLKVIIESGELKEPSLIRRASEISIDAGADFIKTSTGKVAINATLEAAEIMLNVIKEKNPSIGFKAAGGVKDAQSAREYIELAESIMGSDWVDAGHFRFGASSLLGNLLAELGHGEVSKKEGY